MIGIEANELFMKLRWMDQYAAQVIEWKPEITSEERVSLKDDFIIIIILIIVILIVILQIDLQTLVSSKLLQIWNKQMCYVCLFRMRSSYSFEVSVHSSFVSLITFVHTEIQSLLLCRYKPRPYITVNASLRLWSEFHGQKMQWTLSLCGLPVR